MHDIYSDKANISIPFVYDSATRNDKDAADIVANDEVDDQMDQIEPNIVETSFRNEDDGFLDDANGCLANELDQIDSNNRNDEHSEGDGIVNMEDAASLASVEVDFANGSELEVLSIIDVDSFLDDMHSRSQTSSQHSRFSAGPSNVEENNRKRRKTAAAPIQKDVFISDEETFGDTVGQPDSESDSRIARFKKQLSERPNGKQPHKRQIASNAAAFISDANLKRAETLQEKNRIDLSRMENERAEVNIKSQRFEFDKFLYKQQVMLNREEVRLKNEELHAKIKLRNQKFDFKLKQLEFQKIEQDDNFQLRKLELEKAERMEKYKIDAECKLKLDIEKMKN